jgi:hypothetical protein
MQIHYRLAFDERGYPMMYVFDTCKAFIRTMPTLMYDDHKPEDLDSDGEDHVADETRYFLMGRPIKPRTITPASKFNQGPLHQILELEEKDMMPAPKIARMERF